ncbi:Major facilitator superfamily domain general substrate transporter [Penicillium cataractarum]|uniref:Major facilitator superfamily domain general substrate transporter n=1 Tax=Penicillium cataractarum TaxID=2100454 RepID=A0A9W9SHG7_9EURO|nr:Major facilitator superfamily domain general substrate transporter [Penicillium cataractarum]KAJ5378242.1 Major facilitator superfamily domain general substrate transporter [Penicillium cataractarum]
MPKDPKLVEWNGPDDPENPQNFSPSKKWLITVLFSSMTTWVTFSSSVFSAAVEVTAKEYHVSNEVTTLGTSLTLLGFALGPLIWGPMSELYGPFKPLYLGYAVFVILQIPVAVAQNLETILVCRFLVGFFGTSPLAAVGGAFVDFWGPLDRAMAVCLYAAATFVGPIFGPIMSFLTPRHHALVEPHSGGFLVDSHLGWRWTAWITMIASSFFGIIAFFITPETYHPVLLHQRAAKLRTDRNDPAYYSLLDRSAPTFRDVLTKYLFRPFQMPAMKPILVCFTIYISLIYGVMVGIIIGGIFITITTKTYYARKLHGGAVRPEDRLPSMIPMGVLFPAGLFWFAWTSNSSVPWPVQVVAEIPTGAGILVIWLQGLNYLMDVYFMFANSALSANTLVHSTVGGAFPLFATYMYDTLGVAWATSLLGFLSVAMIPIPFVFYFYGPRIRALSRYTPKL